MKIIIQLLFLGLLISNPLSAQQVTINFTVDNIFSAYVGKRNGVKQNKVPATEKHGSEIFTSTSVTTSYKDGDWFYIIAWSDDSGCQGMIGEIEYNGTKISTGSSGWEVFPTGKNINSLSQAPTKAQINQQIALANRNRGWLSLSTGPQNKNTNKVCGAYPRPVNGISDEAKWVWYNSKETGSPFYPGADHGEYLIFRFPVKRVIDPDGDCCTELRKEVNWLKREVKKLKRANKN